MTWIGCGLALVVVGLAMLVAGMVFDMDARDRDRSGRRSTWQHWAGDKLLSWWVQVLFLGLGLVGAWFLMAVAS